VGPAVRPGWARQLVAYLSAALLAVSAIFGLCTFARPNFDAPPAAAVKSSAASSESAGAPAKNLSAVGTWKAGILLFWVLIPPVWFWLEYFGLYRYDDPKKDEKPDWDSFKYGQDMSAKIWLALVTALTILYFGKDIKG
jgi:hypothetical protein